MKNLIRLYSFWYGCLGTLCALAWHVAAMLGRAVMPDNVWIVEAIFALHALASLATFHRTSIRPSWLPVLNVTVERIRLAKTLFGLSLLPGLGYIRFRHYFPPAGLLFFIVERESGAFVPLRRTPSMEDMLARRRRAPAPSANRIALAEGASAVKIARWPIAGAVAGIVTPVPWQHCGSPSGEGIVSLLFQTQHNAIVLCIYIPVLVVLIIRNRSRPVLSFALAFLAGTVAAFIAHVH